MPSDSPLLCELLTEMHAKARKRTPAEGPHFATIAIVDLIVFFAVLYAILAS
jgi:hypothetical protein